MCKLSEGKGGEGRERRGEGGGGRGGKNTQLQTPIRGHERSYRYMYTALYIIMRIFSKKDYVNKKWRNSAGGIVYPLIS